MWAATADYNGRMNRDHVLATLRSALPALREEFGVRDLYLFGSYARGDARPDSDVDVLVEFEVGRTPTLLTLAAVYGQLTDVLGCPVDLGTVGSLRPRLRRHVESEMLRVA